MYGFMEREHELEEQTETVNWQTVATALASIVFAMFGWLMLNFWSRLTVIESLVAQRGERIAILEQESHQNRADVTRVTDTLDKLNIAITEMRADHRQITTTLERMKR
jgi:septation ring formation regulator EzrA